MHSARAYSSQPSSMVEGPPPRQACAHTWSHSHQASYRTLSSYTRGIPFRKPPAHIDGQVTTNTARIRGLRRKSKCTSTPGFSSCFIQGRIRVEYPPLLQFPLHSGFGSLWGTVCVSKLNFRAFRRRRSSKGEYWHWAKTSLLVRGEPAADRSAGMPPSPWSRTMADSGFHYWTVCTKLVVSSKLQPRTAIRALSDESSRGLFLLGLFPLLLGLSVLTLCLNELHGPQDSFLHAHLWLVTQHPLRLVDVVISCHGAVIECLARDRRFPCADKPEEPFRHRCQRQTKVFPNHPDLGRYRLVTGRFPNEPCHVPKIQRLPIGDEEGFAINLFVVQWLDGKRVGVEKSDGGEYVCVGDVANIREVVKIHVIANLVLGLVPVVGF